LVCQLVRVGYVCEVTYIAITGAAKREPFAGGIAIASSLEARACVQSVCYHLIDDSMPKLAFTATRLLTVHE